MVIKECVARATEILKNAGIDTCVLDARVLMCNTLGKDDIYIAVNGDKAVSKNDEERFFALVGRRALYEPVAYITGEKEFMSLMFFVGLSKVVSKASELTAQKDFYFVAEKLFCPFRIGYVFDNYVCVGFFRILLDIGVIRNRHGFQPLIYCG